MTGEEVCRARLRRLLAFGLGCFAAGWVLAGCLEFWHAPVLVDIAVFLTAALAIAAITDTIPRRRKG